MKPYIYIYSSPKGLKKYLLGRKLGRKSKKNNRFSYIVTGKNIPNGTDIDLRDEIIVPALVILKLIQ